MKHLFQQRLNVMWFKRHLSGFSAFLVLACVACSAEQLRPPSVPLVACDPYFSIWSPTDKLNASQTVHWTGKPHRLRAMVRVDEQAYRLMGAEPREVSAMEQVKLEVLPTRSIYTFEGHGVRCTLTFMTPALPDDLMIYSRPVTYVTFDAISLDNKRHAVRFYFDAGAEICVNTPDQPVKWGSMKAGKLSALGVGSVEQAVLGKRGDDLRIDWGYFYVAAEDGKTLMTSAGPGAELAASFAGKGNLPPSVAGSVARPSETGLVLAMAIDLGKVGPKTASTYLILAYDDAYSIQYFKKNLRPYWRKNGDNAVALLIKSRAEYASLQKRCKDFDEKLIADLAKKGGDKYAQICALAYRQCHAASKVVADDNGHPLMFPKENFSNGCIGTVDIIYPMAPQYLLLSPNLTKAMLVPVLDYVMSPRWKWPFAPHDLGTYPLANGQVYGGGERTEENQMPVEESGNMLILLAALAKVEGNAAFSERYWPVLEKWANYLQTKGFDPENQLCTDDFAGHLAHNVNLSAKAICGLGAFAQLSAMLGHDEQARRYRALAKKFAAKWVEEAADGDHYKLAFDRPGTWSQKYNLVWDRILGLNLFPEEVFRKEMAHYKKSQNTYGLPLDNRQSYTKLDWITWTATLTGDADDFKALIEPVYKFVDETPSRVPMSDWYDTKTSKMSGFQARSVVGGVFLSMLYDGALWREYAGKDRARLRDWAPLPEPPEVTMVVPPSRDTGASWQFTTETPSDDWFKPGADVSKWKTGAGGFGTKGTPSATIGTEWRSANIWLRREIEVPDKKFTDLQLLIHHDEDAEVFINGTTVARLRGFTSDYETVPLRLSQSLLKPGKNLIAIHCRQTSGGQFIDAGIVDILPNIEKQASRN